MISPHTSAKDIVSDKLRMSDIADRPLLSFVALRIPHVIGPMRCRTVPRNRRTQLFLFFDRNQKWFVSEAPKLIHSFHSNTPHTSRIDPLPVCLSVSLRLTCLNFHAHDIPMRTNKLSYSADDSGYVRRVANTQYLCGTLLIINESVSMRSRCIFGRPPAFRFEYFAFNEIKSMEKRICHSLSRD